MNRPKFKTLPDFAVDAISNAVSDSIASVEFVTYPVEYYQTFIFCWSIINPTILSIYPQNSTWINHSWKQFKILSSFTVESVSHAVSDLIPPFEYISCCVDYYPLINCCCSIINPTILSIYPHNEIQIEFSNWIFNFIVNEHKFKTSPDFAVDALSDAVSDLIASVEFVTYPVEYYQTFLFCWSFINPTIVITHKIQPR